MANISTEAESPIKSSGSPHRRLLGNRSFLWLWGGQTVSTFGDAFFNLAVLWIVYAQSGSMFQTALIQVVWQLSDIVFGPVAGVLADRWDRRRIMVVTNLLAAAVVAIVAMLMALWGELAVGVVLVAIFALNSLTTFLTPARFAIMPTVIGRDLLATASGLFSTAGQLASLLGNALAGLLIAAVGAVWAVVIDASSFLFVALCIIAARLPPSGMMAVADKPRPSFIGELRDGWRAIADQPVVRAMLWLGLLINIPSFLGPLYPALVSQRLQGGAATYGALEAASVIGAMAGGATTGVLERRIGAGRLLIAGWAIAGFCTLGIGLSTSFIVTAIIQTVQVFMLVAGGIALGALTQGLIADEYLGRVAGITRSLNVIAIPFSTIIAGWLADRVGLLPMFVVGAAITLAVAGLAWSNSSVRHARI